MPLSDQLMTDLKAAMREKDTVARDTLRMLKSDLGAEALRLGRDLTEEDEMTVLKRAVKTRQDAIASYEEGGRADSADQERREIDVIERYLPAQLDEGKTREVLRALAEELGVTSKKDMGRLMKELKSRFTGQVDMRLASKLAGEVLTS